MRELYIEMKQFKTLLIFIVRIQNMDNSKEMRVRKRNGELENVSFDKILYRKKLLYKLCKLKRE